MVGIGETYLPAFVLAVTASQLACGLIATVPTICGALLQLVSPYAVRRLGSYRRWVVLSAAIQATAFLPLVAGSLIGRLPLWVAFASASIYWGAGLATGPAWNAWVETLVPQRLRARFFARRTRFGQWGLLVGFVAGGLVLQASTRLDHPLAAFGLLFLVAAVSRLISACYLSRQREPAPPGDELRTGGIGGLVSAVKHGGNTGVLLFMLATQMAVYVASPYFTPYMLVHLKLSYWGYVVVTCTAFLAKIALLPASARAVQRFGAGRVLGVSAMIIAPIPAFWFLHDSFVYLLLLQVLAGAAWGAYDLAMLLLFFETIPGRQRVGVLTVFNLANCSAIVAGSVAGGALLSLFGATMQAYLAVFVASAVARAIALPLLFWVPSPSLERGRLGGIMRAGCPRSAARSVATRPIAVRPSIGTMDRPVLASLEASPATPGRQDAGAAVPARPAALDADAWQTPARAATSTVAP